jgi:flagellar protein FlgJ
LREVARQFESIFTKIGDPLFGSDQADMYQDMMDDQLAVEMSQGKGLGLADMLIRQLSHGANVQAPGEVAPAAPADLPLDDAAKQKFIEKMLPAATAAGAELGVDPRAIIAQAALETGWGASQPGQGGQASHNFFGIKAGRGWEGDSVAARTQEFRGGVARDEIGRFRAYGSPGAGIADYVSVLRDNPRYAAALNTGGDVRAFATALQKGGYATDPDYANKLVSVARTLGLRQDFAASLKVDHTGPIADLES